VFKIQKRWTKGAIGNNYPKYCRTHQK